MSGNTIAMLEMLFPFGLFMSFLIWELVKTKRSIREDRAREAQVQAELAAREADDAMSIAELRTEIKTQREELDRRFAELAEREARLASGAQAPEAKPAKAAEQTQG
jgi:CRISPR/Cas system CSM-associated protein Csm2 small subunit